MKVAEEHSASRQNLFHPFVCLFLQLMYALNLGEHIWLSSESHDAEDHPRATSLEASSFET